VSEKEKIRYKIEKKVMEKEMFAQALHISDKCCGSLLLYYVK